MEARRNLRTGPSRGLRPVDHDLFVHFQRWAPVSGRRTGGRINGRAQRETWTSYEAALWPEYFLGLRRSFTSTTAKRIEKVDPWKVSFIVRHDETAIRFSSGGNDHIQSVSWTSCRSAFRHEARPYKSSFLVKGKHSASKEGLRALRAAEPLFQFFVLFPGRLLQYTTMDFCQTERRDIQIAVILIRHPFEKRGDGWGLVILLMMLVSSK
jgi:hypothetical protein